PKHGGAWTPPLEAFGEAKLTDEGDRIPVRAEQVVIELLQPGGIRLVPDLESCSQATGYRFPFDDGYRPPSLRQAQRDRQTERAAAQNGDSRRHGSYIADSLRASAGRSGYRRAADAA